MVIPCSLKPISSLLFGTLGTFLPLSWLQFLFLSAKECKTNSLSWSMGNILWVTEMCISSFTSILTRIASIE